MAEVARRQLLTHGSLGVGAAVAGMAVAGPHLVPPGVGTQPAAGAESLLGPVVVHVRDAARAEVALLVGTQEIIFRDPGLIARLVQAAGRRPGGAGLER
jgi:hypothetical protein